MSSRVTRSIPPRLTFADTVFRASPPELSACLNPTGCTLRMRRLRLLSRVFCCSKIYALPFKEKRQALGHRRFPPVPDSIGWAVDIVNVSGGPSRGRRKF